MTPAEGESTRLRAGPLEVELLGAELGYARLGDQELLRRIYVGVRPESWDTVTPEIESLTIDAAEDGFVVRLIARHRNPPVDFRWEGAIEGSSSGRLSFRMDGEALTSFLYGRIGLCVLHASADYAGKPYGTRNGSAVRHGEFPTAIGSQPFVNGLYEPLIPEFTELEVALRTDLQVSYQLQGDLFEVEDQRNWTDASFKTYSTPLRLGSPHRAERGQRFAQQVVVTASGAALSRRPSRRPVLTPTIELGAPLSRTLPSIGATVPTRAVSSLGAALLRRLRLGHVRAHVRLPGDFADVDRAVAIACTVKADLELVLHTSEAGAAQVPSLVAQLPAASQLARLLLLQHGADVTPQRTFAALWQALRHAGVTAPVGGGTGLWFAELNRERSLASGWDFVAYGISPQLHMADDRSIMESLPVQAETVTQARRRYGERPVIVGPVCLRPSGSGFTSTERGDGEHVEDDARQRSMFCAAWTLASLKHLASAGAAAITCHELVGAAGLIDDPVDASTRLPRPYPVHQVLLELSDRELLQTTPSDPLATEALAFGHNGEVRLVVANLLSRPQRVRVARLPGGTVTMKTLRSSPGEPGTADGPGRDRLSPRRAKPCN